MGAGVHAFDRQSYTDYVTIPSSTPVGGATLRWYWVCKWTSEVFTSCIDVNIVAGSGAPSDPISNPGTGSCVSRDVNCAASRCCSDANKLCYEKNQCWSGCVESCTPGIHPDDEPEFQTPWSCQLLDNGNGPSPEPEQPTSPPTPPPTPQQQPQAPQQPQQPQPSTSLPPAYETSTTDGMLKSGSGRAAHAVVALAMLCLTPAYIWA